MIKPIVKDVVFLGQKSELATADDGQIISIGANAGSSVRNKTNLVCHPKLFC